MAVAGVNHWLLEIQRELDKSRVDVVPKGWKTTEQLAAEIHHTKSYTNKLIARALKAGAIEEKNFRIELSNGIFPVRHIREKSSSPLASRRASRSSSLRAS